MQLQQSHHIYNSYHSHKPPNFSQPLTIMLAYVPRGSSVNCRVPSKPAGQKRVHSKTQLPKSSTFSACSAQHLHTRKLACVTCIDVSTCRCHCVMQRYKISGNEGVYHIPVADTSWHASPLPWAHHKQQSEAPAQAPSANAQTPGSRLIL